MTTNSYNSKHITSQIVKKMNPYSKTLHYQFKNINKGRNLNDLKIKLIENQYLNIIYTKLDKIFDYSVNEYTKLIESNRVNFKQKPFILRNEYYNKHKSVIDSNYDTAPMPKDIFTRFTSERAKVIIRNHKLFTHIYKLSICGVTIQLRIHVKKKLDTLIRQHIKRIITRIIFVIYFFKDATCNTKELLNIDLFIIDSKKTIPKNRKTKLDVDNINSGYTSFISNGDKNIVIFREEEINKILVHELIHFFYLDFYIVDCNISKFLNVKPNLEFIPNESYTEFMTIILHSGLLSKETTGLITHSFNILHTETLFGLFQCAKILFHYNYESIEDFFIPYRMNKLNNNNNSGFYQNSCILSYFFIKTSFLINIDKSTRFLEDETNHSHKVSCSDNTKQKFIDLIKLCLDDKFYQYNIGLYLKLIQAKLLTKSKLRKIKLSCKKTHSSKLSRDNAKFTSCKQKQLETLKYKTTKFGKNDIYQTNRMSLIEL